MIIGLVLDNGSRWSGGVLQGGCLTSILSMSPSVLPRIS